MLKQRLQTIDSLAVIRGQKIVEPTVGFSRIRTIETMERLAIMKGQSIVKTMVRLSS